MTFSRLISIFFCLLLLQIPLATNAADFPGRPNYPDVKPMELADLAKKFDNVIVVDARSQYEYDTLHIKSAVNIPVSSPNFAKQVRDISQLTKKPLVFYCNGHTCMKSYKAARAAKLAGVVDCYAYDAGVFDWAKNNPGKTVLLGKAMKSANQLLSKTKLKKHTITPKEFSVMVEKKNNVQTIDVRSRFQRAGVGLFPFNEKWVPLEKTSDLEKALEEAATRKKTLLIYDEVGKQVRWLQYRLEEMGVRKYYFMKGGAAGYIKSI